VRRTLSPGFSRIFLALCLIGVSGTSCGGTRKLLRQADDYAADQRWTAAVRTYERVLDKKPGQPEALVGIARAWLNTDEPERAIVPAQVAAEAKVAGGTEVLIDALLTNGKGASALTLASERAGADPTSPIARTRLVETQLAKGELAAAAADAEKVVELNGGAPGMALAAWTQARNNNCGRASQVAARAAANALTDVQVQAEAAAVFRLCGDAAAATAAANAARALLMDGPKMWALQADRRAKGGDYEGAVRRYSWMRAVYPDEGPYAAQLGIAYLKAGDGARAAGELESALKMAPYASTGALSSGVHVAYRTADQLGENERQAMVEKLYEALSQAESLRGDRASYARTLEKGLRQKGSRDPAEWLRVVGAWAAAPDPSPGMEAARIAADLAPNAIEPRILMARIHASRGEVDRAVGQAHLAFRSRPKDVELALFLGNLLVVRGERAEAARVYKECLNLNPNDARLQSALSRLQP